MTEYFVKHSARRTREVIVVAADINTCLATLSLLLRTFSLFYFLQIFIKVWLADSVSFRCAPQLFDIRNPQEVIAMCPAAM